MKQAKLRRVATLPMWIVRGYVVIVAPLLVAHGLGRAARGAWTEAGQTLSAVVGMVAIAIVHDYIQSWIDGWWRERRARRES